MKIKSINQLLIFLLLIFNFQICNAQWSNRYQKVDGFGHHVYLEGYELPVMNSGPTDPAPSPDGSHVAFSAKGWLWILDLASGEAKRITSGGEVDTSPNWAPDGNQIVFVRDNSLNTSIVLIDLKTSTQSTIVDTPALELNPIFSSDGKSVWYASAEKGSLDIWKTTISTSVKVLVTTASDLERLPNPTSDGKKLVYLRKLGFSYDSIELLDLEDSTSTPLIEENFTSQAAFSLAPDDRTLAYTWPNGDDYELRLLDISIPKSILLLTKSNGLPLTPKFSYDGNWVYFSEYHNDERARLKRIKTTGGDVESIEIKNWNWQAPTSKLKIKSLVDGKKDAVRMNITSSNGHPIIPESGIVHSEGQNGIVFFYSPGNIEITVPSGEVTVTAVQGFTTVKTVRKTEIKESNQEIEINLSNIWNPSANGWFAGDNHFHLNYGGTNNLDPQDIELDLKAEGIDFAYPLLANLGNRFLEQDIWDWNNEEAPFIRFGQEVRSHFLGHLGLVGTSDLYWPWVWGPYYDIYGRDDRLNAEPLRFTRNQNGLGAYVHPVSIKDPMNQEGARRVPVSLVADCVLGETDLLELGCLWTDEIGTGEVWHSILNIGVDLGITAGSDVMNDLYRTMAIGATRVYVKPEGSLTQSSYLASLKQGKSFVTNGPLMEFKIDGNEPGNIISRDKKKVKWTLNTYSTVSFESIEIFVNGNVVWTKKANPKSTNQSFKGAIEVPEGGWVTARISGGITEWPLMDSYPFAETSPIWFGKKGSIETKAAMESAKDLLMILKVSQNRLEDGYGDSEIPKLLAHFEAARKKLESIANQ